MIFSLPRTGRNLLFLLTASLSFVLPLASVRAEGEILSSESRETAGELTTPGFFVEGLTVSGGRLPSFQIPFGEVPGNTSYIAANTTEKNTGQVHERFPVSLQEALQDTESAVLFDAVGSGLDTTLSLRGFNQSNALVVLVDGVRVNETDGNAVTFPLIRLNDVSSIQIDRGSASHIYGDGAFGGVVHITTGQASESPFSAFGGLELASHQGIRFHQGISGTLTDRLTPMGGRWSYYFKGGRDLGDGFRADGDYRITDFDFKTAYELPEERGRFHFGLKHVDDAISNPGELTFDQYQADPMRGNKPHDGRNFKTTILSVGADGHAWEKRLTFSVLASLRRNLNQFYTTSGTFQDFTSGSNPDTDFVSTKSRQSDLIWQLSYVDVWEDIRNRTYLGMEFRDASEFSIERDAFGRNIPVDALVETERDSDISSTGLFWRQSLEFFERIMVYAGMRHDFHWLKSEDLVTPTDTISRRWRQSSVSTGLTVKAAEWVSFFCNYSQGFRVPTISDIAPFSGTTSQGLNPERSDSYEAGTRLKLRDKGLLKASWFLIDLKDEIAFDATTTGPTAPFGQNMNLGSSRRTGVELRMDINPVRELDLYGAYTWTRAWNRMTNPAGTLPDGRSLGQVPEHRATWGLTVRPLMRFGEAAEGFRVSLTGTYTGKQHPQAYETTSQAVLNAAGAGGAGHFIKAYSVWDLITAYRWKDMEIYFKITNLFDHQYISRSVSATSFGTAIYPAGTYNFVIPGAPREYAAGFRWRIG